MCSRLLKLIQTKFNKFVFFFLPDNNTRAGIFSVSLEDFVNSRVYFRSRVDREEKPTTIRSLCAHKCRRDKPFSLRPPPPPWLSRLTARRGRIHDFARHPAGDLSCDFVEGYGHHVACYGLNELFAKHFPSRGLSSSVASKCGGLSRTDYPFTSLSRQNLYSAARYYPSICRKFSKERQGS